MVILLDPEAAVQDPLMSRSARPTPAPVRSLLRSAEDSDIALPRAQRNHTYILGKSDMGDIVYEPSTLDSLWRIGYRRQMT